MTSINKSNSRTHKNYKGKEARRPHHGCPSKQSKSRIHVYACTMRLWSFINTSSRRGDSMKPEWRYSTCNFDIIIESLTWSWRNTRTPRSSTSGHSRRSCTCPMGTSTSPCCYKTLSNTTSARCTTTSTSPSARMRAHCSATSSTSVTPRCPWSNSSTSRRNCRLISRSTKRMDWSKYSMWCEWKRYTPSLIRSCLFWKRCWRSGIWGRHIQEVLDRFCCRVWSCISCDMCITITGSATIRWASMWWSLWSSMRWEATGRGSRFIQQTALKCHERDNREHWASTARRTTRTTSGGLHLRFVTCSTCSRTGSEWSQVRTSHKASRFSSSW